MRFNEHPNATLDYRRATDLRNNASPAEQRLWRLLREQATTKGLKFRRQQALHPYIVDFACMKARLLIELDGFSHDVRQDYDKIRTAYLEKRGFVVVRFSNEDIAQNLEGVVMTIINRAEQLAKDFDEMSNLQPVL